MSLEVPAALLARAEAGPVDDAEFVGCVRESLPYAWQVVSAVAGRLADAPPDQPYAVHATPPPSEAHRGPLLRAPAADAIRGGVEGDLGGRLAFRHCRPGGPLRPADVGGTG